MNELKRKYVLTLLAVIMPLTFCALQLFFKIVSEDKEILYTILITWASISISLFLNIYFKILDLTKQLNSIEEKRTNENESQLLRIQNSINESVSEARSLIKIIGKDMKNGVNRKFIQLSKNNHTKKIGNECLQKHIEKFESKKNGFKVEGHNLSMEAYIELWDYLNQIQESIYNECKINGSVDKSLLDKKCLIFRSTHSNEIKVFDHQSEHNTYAIKIRNKQKDFMSNGGYIIRIVMGKKEEPEPYEKKVIEQMSSLSDKMDIRYLKSESLSNQGREYDFAWITNDERGLNKRTKLDFIAIWISDSQNKNIASCEIYEERIKKYVGNWKDIGSIVETDTEKFKIPDFRNFSLNTKLFEDDN